MFVPVPQGAVSPAVPQADAVDLKVALKLLSGKECVRDASQAQKMLLRLVESTDAAVAADAARLVKAGVANDWFTSRTPHHYELERIAEASLALLARRPDLMRMRIVLIAGVAMLVAGIAAFLIMGGGSVDADAPFPIVAVVVLIAIVALLVTRFTGAAGNRG